MPGFKAVVFAEGQLPLTFCFVSQIYLSFPAFANWPNLRPNYSKRAQYIKCRQNPVGFCGIRVFISLLFLMKALKNLIIAILTFILHAAVHKFFLFWWKGYKIYLPRDLFSFLRKVKSQFTGQKVLKRVGKTDHPLHFEWQKISVSRTYTKFTCTHIFFYLLPPLFLSIPRKRNCGLLVS